MTDVDNTDWWGLELVLPPPTLAYLNVRIISSFRYPLVTQQEIM